MASVSLMPVPNPNNATPDKAGLNTASSKTAAPVSSVNITVQTNLDGSYTIPHVASGSYYVTVRKDGYINPVSIFSEKQLDEPNDQVRNLIEQALPKVNVEQDSTAHADVQLQRGAAVRGTISFDDETPASGIHVTLLHKDENGKWVLLSGPAGGGPAWFGGPSSTTDDRGAFRIASLLPDTYLIRADLGLENEKTYKVTDASGRTTGGGTMRNSMFSLSFYGDGTTHMDEATPFTLKGDEERAATDMTLPISKLHRLTCHVSAPNGHFVNAASVELVYGPDKKTLARSNIDREDGLFHFEFVPEGAYTLRVTNARDITWDPNPSRPAMSPAPPGFPGLEKERVLETYGNVDIPLILRGDMTGITATVPEKQTNPTAASN
jgi:hypothetical protein